MKWNNIMKFKTANSNSIGYVPLMMTFFLSVRLYFFMSLYFTAIHISNFFQCTRWLSKLTFLQSLNIVRPFVVLPFNRADSKRPLALEKFAYRNNEHAENKLQETIRSAVSAVPREASFYQFIHQVSKVCGNWTGWSTTSSSSYICHGVGPLVDPLRSHVSRSLFKGLPWFLLPVGE